MSEDRWQFWIDVGGTFTDCIARRPDGMLIRKKLLSSGVIKASVGRGSTQIHIVASLEGVREDFWKGYELRWLDESGSIVSRSTVAASSPSEGVLRLENALPFGPKIGQLFELASGQHAPIVAIRMLLGLRLDDPLPPVTVRLGTTRGTNALLTRTGRANSVRDDIRFRRYPANRLPESPTSVRACDQEASTAIRRIRRNQ